MDLLDFSGRKERLTKEEKKFIKSKVKKSSFKMIYAFYNKKSFKDKHIALIIDRQPNVPRRSGVMNNWDIVSKRDLTNIEYDEEIENYGCCNRRFTVWYYQYIEQLVQQEKECYNVDVPEEFIRLAKEKGYTGSVQQTLKFE